MSPWKYVHIGNILVTRSYFAPNLRLSHAALPPSDHDAPPTLSLSQLSVWTRAFPTVAVFITLHRHGDTSQWWKGQGFFFLLFFLANVWITWALEQRRACLAVRRLFDSACVCFCLQYVARQASGQLLKIITSAAVICDGRPNVRGMSISLPCGETQLRCYNSAIGALGFLPPPGVTSGHLSLHGAQDVVSLYLSNNVCCTFGKHITFKKGCIQHFHAPIMIIWQHDNPSTVPERVNLSADHFVWPLKIKWPKCCLFLCRSFQ